MRNLDRTTKILLGLLVVGVWCLLLQSVFQVSPVEASGPNGGEQTPQVIRARGLVIVDEQNRERIIMGAPVPDPPHIGKRINPAHGMIILDHNGYERFGVGIMDNNGQMAMGFDAPHDPANPKKVGFVSMGTGAYPTGEHTASCADPGCNWAYGSEGGTYDLRVPTAPVKLAQGWQAAMRTPEGTKVTLTQGAHDFSRGTAVRASRTPPPRQLRLPSARPRGPDNAATPRSPRARS